MKLFTGVRLIFSPLILIGLVLGMQACGGGGGSPPAAPSATGYYDTGSISAAGTGNLRGIVNGSRLMFYSATSNRLYDVTMTITNTNFNATVVVYTSGLSPVPATITGGSFIEGSSITGVVTGGGSAIDGTFTLSYANTNNDFSALSKVAHGWGPLKSIGLDFFTFDATGQFTSFADFPLNSTYIANCTVSTGPSIKPIASTRLYSLNFTLANCTTPNVEGTYSGLATTFVDANPDDRLIYMVTNANNLVSLFDIAQL